MALLLEDEIVEAALRWYLALSQGRAAQEVIERAKLVEILRDLWQKRA